MRVVVIGAGMGGLAAAVDLARQGCAVTVVETAAAPGGKMRQVMIDGACVDAGPTVLTMRWIFDELFDDAGTTLDAQLALTPAGILARHAWDGAARLDLHADMERTVASIGGFAGRTEADGYRRFCARAGEIFDTLDQPFIRRQRPRLDQLVTSFGFAGMGRLSRINPFDTLASALRDYFRDPRLLQLFGRYATYCGSSPYRAPATLMLVAHVERVGVWLVGGGMHALAAAVADLAARHGATLRYGTAVTRIERVGGRVGGVVLADGARLPADAVVVNADVAALGAGLFGEAVTSAVPRPAPRSLSAVTFAMRARASGFPLVRHNVFFSRDYPAEFDAIFKRGRVPDEPTVYVCAQDRGDDDAPRAAPERLLCLVNAPADGRTMSEEEITRCGERMRTVLTRCGLEIDAGARVATDPGGFAALFPATGGALYGPVPHGWQASFQRAGSRATGVPGLYLAGGSVHPGPGVPMAAMSGRLAAAALLADRARSAASTPRWRPTVTPGGTSTR